MTNVVGFEQQPHRSHNTPTAKPTRYSQEAEDKVMGVLPRPLADWLRYDAPADTCPVVIFQEWRAGRTVEQLLAGLRAIRRQDTCRDYGLAHPQAFPPRRMAA